MPIVTNEQPRKGGFSLGDYVEVKDRIKLFYAAYPDGRLVTSQVVPSSEPDGTPRIWVEALAYRTPDDPQPGRGWSWMVLPGSTTYTRGSELENTETSAWGRAIGALGIGIDKSIASVDEIGAKGGEAPRKVEPVAASPDGGLIGIVEAGTASDSDYQFRDGSTRKDGLHIIGFRLRDDGRGGIKVVARGNLAKQLAEEHGDLVGTRVECYGRIRDETFRPKGSKRDVTYQVLDLERIRTPDWELPAPQSRTVGNATVGGVVEVSDFDQSTFTPIAPGQELLPLDEDEKAAIAGGLE